VIGVCYMLAAVALLAIGLSTFLAVVAFKAWNKAAEMTQLAEKRGAELDERRLTEANDATKTALDAEKNQERRGDVLEKGIADASKPDDPADGLQRLQELSTPAVPGRPDPSRPKR